MKKAIVLSLTLSLVLGMTGCAKTENAPAAESTVEAVTEASSAVPEETTAAASEEASTETTAAAGTEGVLSYAEYMAAELDSEVVVETYVQAKQSWWEDKATVYIPRIRTAPISCTIWPAQRKTMKSWFPEPKSG